MRQFTMIKMTSLNTYTFFWDMEQKLAQVLLPSGKTTMIWRSFSEIPAPFGHHRYTIQGTL